MHTSGNLDGVPEFVASNLLLIVQEAVYNALRHGRPANVHVTVSDEPATQAIESTPGSGTAVRATVIRRAYDREIGDPAEAESAASSPGMTPRPRLTESRSHDAPTRSVGNQAAW